MDSAGFDRFADEYLAVHARNIAITGEQPEFFAEYKVRDVYEILAAEGRPVASLILSICCAFYWRSVPQVSTTTSLRPSGSYPIRRFSISVAASTPFVAKGG